MSITIDPIPGTVRLRVGGDLETVLTVPFDDDDRFFVGVSDGTLLTGTYDENLRCSWSVAQHGAAIIRVVGDRVELDWRVEWVTAAVYNSQMAQSEAPTPLPLFPGLDMQAA